MQVIDRSQSPELMQQQAEAEGLLPAVSCILATFFSVDLEFFTILCSRGRRRENRGNVFSSVFKLKAREEQINESHSDVKQENPLKTFKSVY